MRQNFIVDNIVKLKVPTVIGTNCFVHTNSEPVVGVNSAVAAQANSTSSSFQLVFDSDSDSLFSFDYRLTAQDVGASGDHCVMVATYVASSPAAVGFNFASHYCGLFPTFVIGDSLSVSGRCVVPSLPLSDGEQQFVVVGLGTFNNSNVASVSRFLQCRVHTEDVTVFDPLRQ